MKKFILPAVIVVALFFSGCQNPAGDQSPASVQDPVIIQHNDFSGVEVTIDALSTASLRAFYEASYRVDSLKIPVNSIADITMICDYDTVLIDAGSVEYGNSVAVININSEYVRTVYAFADFVTVHGDTLRDTASIIFYNAKYPYNTRVMRINAISFFKLADLFDDHIFHLYSTDPAKRYSVRANQYASQVVQPPLPTVFGMPDYSRASITSDVRFPNPGQSQSFLVKISSWAGGMIDSYVCPNADTLLLQLSDALSVPTSDVHSIPNLFDQIKNLDSITCTSLDTVNPFRKSYTAADFRNAEEVRQENTRFFPSLGNTSFYLDNSYFYFEIPFENLYINLCYTLQIEFANGQPPVSVFSNVPFPQLLHVGSQW